MVTKVDLRETLARFSDHRNPRSFADLDVRSIAHRTSLALPE